MSSTRIYIGAFDADGCFYNWKYIKIIIEILNMHWDFLEKFGKNQLKENEMNLVSEMAETIFSGLDTIKIYEDGLKPGEIRIKNNSFRLEIEATVIKLQKIKQAQVSALSVIMMVAADFVGYLNKLNKAILPKVILMANKDLITHLCNKIEIQNINRFAVKLFTNRQSFMLDRAGMEQNATWSFYMDLYNVYHVMQQSLKHSIGIVSPFCMADIYGDLKRGESYQRILDEYKIKSDEIFVYNTHANYIFDTNKVTLLYAIVHDVAINVLKELGIIIEEADIVIDFFDNENEILQALRKVFLAYPILIPANVEVNLYPYAGQLNMGPMVTIRGTGVIDYYYRDNVKLMVKLCGHNLQDYANHIDASLLDFEKFLALRVTGREVAPYLSMNFAVLFQGKERDYGSNEKLKFVVQTPVVSK